MEKLTILSSSTIEHGEIVRRLFYWYPVSPRVTNSLGGNIAPRPSSQIPAEVTASFVTAPDRALLDAGDAGFELVTRSQTAGETLTQFKNRLLLDHAARMTWWIAEKRATYAQSGFGASV